MNKIKRCLICGDNATGFNYGGLSCHSCKVFFLRNSHKIGNQICRKGTDTCLIDMQNRRKCAKCRMDKCLVSGMVKNSADNVDDKDDTNDGQTNDEQTAIEPVNPSTSIETLFEINLLSKILFGNLNEFKRFDYSTSKRFAIGLNALEQERIAQIRQISGDVFIDECSLPNVRIAKDIYDGYDAEEVYADMFVKFCKRLDAFKQLKSEDQFVLLKPFCVEALEIRFAFVYDVNIDGLTLVSKENGLEGVIFTREHENVFKNQERIEINRQFYAKLHIEMENDPTIRDLITALLLFKVRPNISRPEFIKYHHALYSRLLLRYLGNKYKSVRRADAKYVKLMKLVNFFDQIAENAQKLMQELDQKRLSHVCIEIYNIV